MWGTLIAGKALPGLLRRPLHRKTCGSFSVYNAPTSVPGRASSKYGFEKHGLLNLLPSLESGPFGPRVCSQTLNRKRTPERVSLSLAARTVYDHSFSAQHYPLRQLYSGDPCIPSGIYCNPCGQGIINLHGYRTRHTPPRAHSVTTMRVYIANRNAPSGCDHRPTYTE